MLWRALKHVENGFFIDIGAQDPVIDSVSLAFCEHGWQGVHVEPTQQYSDKLRNVYLSENVLQMAIGSHEGMLSFYEFEDTGLSTADIEIARRHQEAGFKCIETLVPMISLDSLFERIDVKDVHWLKLDVEGLEKTVLEGWKNTSILPWIFVIESTAPLTQAETYSEWEYLLLDKGYRWIYFDGLNRFYIAPNHLDLVEAFKSPPNIFDNFQLSGSASQPFYKMVRSSTQQSDIRAQQAQAQAQQSDIRAQQAQAQAQQSDIRAQQAQAQAQQSDIRAQQAQAQVKVLLNSKSWLITSPLRFANHYVHRMVSAIHEHRLSSGLKRRLRSVIQQIGRWILRQPLLRKIGFFILNRLPRFRARLRLIIVSSTPKVNLVANSIPILSPRAKLIYIDLKRALEKRQG